MSGFGDGGAVPGGNVGKPLMIALLALLAARYFGGKGKEQPAEAPIPEPDAAQNASPGSILDGLGGLIDQFQKKGFGDAVDMDQETLASVEQHDRAALSAALTGDAEAWFDAIARHGDSTRICGFAALYTMLRVAQVRQGRLLAYEPSVEDTGSVVTYASLTWG